MCSSQKSGTDKNNLKSSAQEDSAAREGTELSSEWKAGLEKPAANEQAASPIEIN